MPDFDPSVANTETALWIPDPGFRDIVIDGPERTFRADVRLMESIDIVTEGMRQSKASVLWVELPKYRAIAFVRESTHSQAERGAVKEGPSVRFYCVRSKSFEHGFYAIMNRRLYWKCDVIDGSSSDVAAAMDAVEQLRRETPEDPSGWFLDR